MVRRRRPAWVYWLPAPPDDREDPVTQQSRWPVVRRLLPYFGRVRGPFLLSLVFLLLIVERLQRAAQGGLIRRRPAAPDSVGTSGTSAS